jgi:hypothetical protein
LNDVLQHTAICPEGSSHPAPGLVAVIVGIDGYDAASEGIKPLRCAANDAVSLSEVLNKVWVWYELNVQSFLALKKESLPSAVFNKIKDALKDKRFPSRNALEIELKSLLTPSEFERSGQGILRHASGSHFSMTTLVWPFIPSQSGKEKQRDAWGIALPKDAEFLTKEGILSALRNAAAFARASDTFLFFFSGHGMIRNNEPCLVTIRDGNTGKGIDFFRISEIQKVMEDCPATKRVMILDCCQTPDAASRDFVTCLKDLAKGWAMFLSCSPGEVSGEDLLTDRDAGDYLNQGLFTASLTCGLRGEASLDGKSTVSLFELAHFVCHRVQLESEKRLAEAQAGEGVNKRSASSVLLTPQHPVLLSEASALGGPLQIVLAPHQARSKHDLRRRLPSPKFLPNFKKYLLGQWPVPLSRKSMVREGGAFLYAGIMFWTLLWYCPQSLDIVRWTLALAVGLASAFLWWIMIPFSVAANEDGWLEGGYITAISVFLLHVFVFFLTSGQMRIKFHESFYDVSRILTFFGLDLFLIMIAVVIFGCNAVQAIIALAETVRKDERREIREAVEAFRQFRTRLWHVDLNNLVAMVSARPVVYFCIMGMGMILLGLNITHTLIFHAADPMIWIILFRDAFFLVFLAWQAFWYAAAFQFIQREVYKR